MTEPGESQSVSPEVAAEFASFVRQLEDGTPVAFEDFCRGRLLLAPELRKIYYTWCAVAQLLEGAERDDGPGTASGELMRLARAGTQHATASALADGSELVRRLATPSRNSRRYRVRRSIDKGGMGEVLEIWDHDLRRRLAMKLMIDRGDEEDPESRDRCVERFLEEAQITAQLDHPGIVPVHDLGLDCRGRVYFTMKLVKGEDFRSVLQHVKRRTDGWSQTRAVGILLKVCEAVAFAHLRGVVHRDLKPANIMVGRFGETYVMDWGLARVARDKPTRNEDRLTRAVEPQRSHVWTDRREVGEARPDSPVFTREGDVLGTPPYMSPEQAAGQQSSIDARSDCYSLGAILYELVTGRIPYVDPTRPSSPRVIRERVLAGPPERIDRIAAGVPAELVSICECAMARDINARYQTMEEMAVDLRAYLENRTVKAHRTGPLVELRKWVARNRAVAGVAAVLLIVIACAGFAVAQLERWRAEEARLATDLRLVSELLGEADGFGAIHPDRVPAFRDWLTRALSFATVAALYREQLTEIATRGLPSDPTADADPHRLPDWERLLLEESLLVNLTRTRDLRQALIDSATATPEERATAIASAAILDEELPFVRRRIERRRRLLEPLRVMRFTDPGTETLYRRLSEIVAKLDALDHPSDGAIARVQADLLAAEGLSATVMSPQHAAAWHRAVDSIANPGECPAYSGLVIRPQIGLIPLDRNPTSGLWEFWHVLSGLRPQRSADGEFRITGATGMVLILVPGGRFWIGSQREDPLRPNYDPVSHASEQPPFEVELDPFFMSKYAMTQGQWIRATGDNPSEWFAGSDYKGYGTVTRSHPVERVDWSRGRSVLARWGLDHPTEAQFERGMRAGTATVFYTGADAASMHRRANWLTEHDPFPFHAPVDSLEPNPFGFFCMAGNVWTWCRDWYVEGHRTRVTAAGTGEFLSGYTRKRSARGGAYNTGLSDLRAARRAAWYPEQALPELGLRPVRQLTR